MAQTQRVGSTATKVTLEHDEKKQTVDMCVKYHDTVVVRFRHATGEPVVLNSGGWRTATTKLRMNQTSNEYDLGFQVFQSKGEWFVTFDGETLDFQDGMTLGTDGFSDSMIGNMDD